MSNNDMNNINFNNNLNEYNDFLSKPVEVNNLFSTTPIRGEVIETTENYITLAPTLSNLGNDSHKSNVDKDNTYYLPNSSIISMKEL